MKKKLLMLSLMVIFILISPVVASSATSKYVEVNWENMINTVTGEVTFLMRGGGGVMNRTILLTNKIAPNISTAVEVLPMGRSNEIPVVPGNYTAFLKDGNGGQPERQDFSIIIGDDKRVVFIGHCISQRHEDPTPLPTPTPTPTVVPTVVPTPVPCVQFHINFIEEPWREDITGKDDLNKTRPYTLIKYQANNPNQYRKTETVIAMSEDYFYNTCWDTQNKAISQCVEEPTPLPTPTINPTPTMTVIPTPTTTPDCNNVYETRYFPSEVYTFPYGYTEGMIKIPRERGHIKYNFGVQTTCLGEL